MAINSSSLDLIATCLRKAHYSLDLELKGTDEAPPLVFGTAMHKILEPWYSLPTEDRELPASQRERAELLAHGHGLDEPTTGPLECLRIGHAYAWGKLSNDEGDKRSHQNLSKIARAYFKHYAKDMLEVARDVEGKPLIERNFEFLMHEEPGLEIRYFGTIDVILRNRQNGLLLVADHKTTAALGQEFYARCKPNPQYTGYVWGARECLGIETDLFMVNGIQVAKTKQEFARQITNRTAEDFEELRLSVVEITKRWLTAPAHGWPMNAPTPCSQYGGCQYLSVCEVPASMKMSVIRAKWPGVVS